MIPRRTKATARQVTAGRLSVPQKVDSTRTVLIEKDDAGRTVSRVRRTVLPGGLRILTEEMAGVRSASIGVWVGVGSRHETPSLHGASHFLEHLLFKGTKERSALEISILLDEIGGDFNAFTAKEYTCFHGRVLDADLPAAIDLLGDMMTSSVITDADVEAERDVILDEIAMHDDDPEDVVHNLFAAQAWGDTPLGRGIAGTEASIESLSLAQIQRFYVRHYRPANIVVSVAGNIDHADVVRRIRAAFGRGDWLTGDEAPVVAALTPKARKITPGESHATRPLEQVNVVLGVRGLTRSDPRRFSLGVLNTVLGGGSSSRLFQEVREQRGLAYSVYSFASHHVDAGLVGVAVGCLPAKLDETLAVVREELRKIAADGITEIELTRGKRQLVGSMIMGLEDSGARMSRNGKAELIYDELIGLDEALSRIEAVTLEDVAALAADLFSGPELLAVVGP